MRVPKVSTAYEIISAVDNWPTMFADYLPIARGPYLNVILRNGIRFKARAKTTDRGAIIDTVARKCYTPEGFDISEQDLVVDVGANIGVFALYASQLATNGKVYALEPHPSNFEMLLHNIENNRVDNIVPINQAMSDETGQQTLFISRNTGGHSLHRKGKHSIPVATLSLEDFTEQYNIGEIDFCKMDCEGGEYSIFSGCSPNILRRIKRISMEYHDLDSDHNGRTLSRLLEDQGFSVRMCAANHRVGMLYARR